MQTALLVLLVHSTARLPSSSVGQKQRRSPVHSEAQNDSRSFDQAKEVTTHFWKSVLSHWCSPKASEGVDTKAILENLILDLLECLNLPELPAACFLLQVDSVA